LNLKERTLKFFKEGAKLKAFVFFKGSFFIYKDQGQIHIKIATDLKNGKVSLTRLEGKRMIMFIVLRKEKKSKV
jgi:translation initiation factor IF-3